MRPIALFLAQQNRSRRIPPPSRFPDEPEWPPPRPAAREAGAKTGADTAPEAAPRASRPAVRSTCSPSPS